MRTRHDRLVSSISHSFLETGQRCFKQLERRYKDKLFPRVKGVKLEKGDWVHLLLAVYYKTLKAKWEGRTKKNPIKVARAAHKQLVRRRWDALFAEQVEQFGEDFPDLCWNLFERYVKHWQQYDRYHWQKILFVEVSIKVDIVHMPVPFNFKCDVVVLDKWGFVRIYDHKVVQTIPNEDKRHLDTQGPRYIVGMQEWLKKRRMMGKVKGVTMIYDYIRSATPAVPKVNKDGKVSKAMIDTDPDVFRRAVEENGQDPDEYKDLLKKLESRDNPWFDRWEVPRTVDRLEYEMQKMQVLSEEYLYDRDFYPTNLDPHRCLWDCDYSHICMAEIEGGDVQAIIKERYVEGRESNRE